MSVKKVELQRENKRMCRIILASGSPRRKELLEQMGLEFEIRPACGEEIVTGTNPEEIVRSLASQKAGEIAEQIMMEYYIAPKDFEENKIKVIGADTIVVCDNQIFGKPSDEADAADMLKRLQGHTHQVYTGVCVMTLLMDQENPDEVAVKEFAEKTDVTMYEINDKEIQEYIATKEPMDKAGAYAIQGLGARFIKEIQGDYYNVVGLPAARLWMESFRSQ